MTLGVTFRHTLGVSLPEHADTGQNTRMAPTRTPIRNSSVTPLNPLLMSTPRAAHPGES